MTTAVFAIAALAIVDAGQGPATPTADLELTVNRVFETAARYHQTFRNLTVEETRINEEFDDSGRVRKRRETVADLLVYRPVRNDAGDTVTEYRDVRLVDGKAVEQRGKRALDLITRATTSASLEEELRLINKAGTRYDFSRSVGGFTIHQLPRPESTLRDDFRFTWVGPTQLNGRHVVELEYREVVPRARQSGIDGLYRGMGITSFFEQGRLWVDTATFQLRRGRFEIVGVHPALPAPVQLISYEATYVESRFDIPVPDRIVFDWYENQKSKAKPVFGLRARMTFTYGAFRQFGVTTDETVSTPAGR